MKSMWKGLIPVFLILAVVAGYFYCQKPAEVLEEEDVLTPEEIHRVEIPFKGRVVIPSASEFTIIDNSAGRNMDQVALFMQGRAAGLHWLAREHFKGATRKRPLPDVHLELKLAVDSMGVFSVLGIQSDTQDRDMLDTLQDHIKKYWRYRRSTSGKTEFVAPFTWTSKY